MVRGVPESPRLPRPRTPSWRSLQSERGLLREPALKLADVDQLSAPAADDPEFGSDVLVEEVAADAECPRRLIGREREPGHGRSPHLLGVLLVHRRAYRRKPEPCSGARD